MHLNERFIGIFRAVMQNIVNHTKISVYFKEEKNILISIHI